MNGTDHCYKDTKFWIHLHIFSISEDKVFSPFFLAGEQD